MRNGSFVMDFDPPQPLVAALCYRVEDKEFYDRLEDQIKRDIPGVISTSYWSSTQGRQLAIGTITFQAQDPASSYQVLNKICAVLEESGFRRLPT